MKLIVGLGNPGAKYNGTRHNVGFAVVDQALYNETPSTVAAKFRKFLGSEWTADRKAEAETGRRRVGAVDVLLVKPVTFMNLSGQAVQSLMTTHRIKSDDVLVVCDDWDLPIGQLRLRRSGGAGGHNGLASIIGTIGEGFPRLRVGIGKPPTGVPGERHVLERFSLSEQPAMGETVARAADAVKLWITEGVEVAMNKYNVSSSSSTSSLSSPSSPL